MYMPTQLGCCGTCKCSSRMGYVPRARRRRLGYLGQSTIAIASTGVGVGTKALATILPAAGPIGAVVGGVLALVSAIFGSHAAAVAREANDLNSAVPAFVQNIQAIFQAANSGQYTTAALIPLVDESVQQYYQAVGSIMKKGGSCPINADCSYPGGSKAGNVPFDNCNGPCSVGCNYVEPTACVAKMVLTNGGTMVTPSSPSHAGYNGAPSLTLSYAPPPPVITTLPPAVQQALAPIVQPVQQALAPVEQAAASIGLPSWVLPAFGGLVVAKILGVI